MRIVSLLCFTSLIGAVEPFKLMQNLDGDLSFTGETPAESKEKLEKLVDDIASGPAKTLMWSIGAGSDILYYPTKVASTWGWRVTKYNDDPKWKIRIERCRMATEAGLDAPRIVGERAKGHGISFYPSYRMNDAHFCSDPLNYPLTGRFWMEHQNASLGASPVPEYEGYKHLLNFADEEVRAYRLSIIFEAIDRNASLMDGIELDFNRFQIFFPPGEAERNAHFITDMLVQVRKRLDSLGEKRKQRLKLVVRVPPSLKNCLWSGLDISEWYSLRLIDALVPAQVMTLAHDMPIDEFVHLAEPAGCEVVGSLYGRSGYIWPFSLQHDSEAYSAEVVRTPTAPQMLGAAINQRFLGAKGVQIYNLILHTQPKIVHALTTQQGARRFLVTQPYFHDHSDTYEYRKQLPVALKTREEASLRLLIGEDASQSTALLRLGFHGTNQAYDDVSLVIEINGHLLHSGSAAKYIVVTSGKRHGIASCPATEAYGQWPVQVERLLKGWNDIRITLHHASKPLKLVETEITLIP